MSTVNSSVITFTGAGKGKTTAALGLALEAALAKKRVTVVQFLKGGGFTGELSATNYLSPYIDIHQFGYGCPIGEEIKCGTMVCNKCGSCFRENKNPRRNFAEKALAFAAQALSAGRVELLILDEISHAIRHGLLDKQAVINLITGRPEFTSIVLTGRYMPAELLALSDWVTECCAVKHPAAAGIDARRGIEY